MSGARAGPAAWVMDGVGITMVCGAGFLAAWLLKEGRSAEHPGLVMPCAHQHQQEPFFCSIRAGEDTRQAARGTEDAGSHQLSGGRAVVLLHHTSNMPVMDEEAMSLRTPIFRCLELRNITVLVGIYHSCSQLKAAM